MKTQTIVKREISSKQEKHKLNSQKIVGWVTCLQNNAKGKNRGLKDVRVKRLYLTISLSARRRKCTIYGIQAEVGAISVEI